MPRERVVNAAVAAGPGVVGHVQRNWGGGRRCSGGRRDRELGESVVVKRDN